MQIFLKGWKTFYRQGSNLFFCIFFPSILTFLLGTFLESMDTAEFEIGEIKAAYVESREEEMQYLTAYLAQIDGITLTAYEDSREAVKDLRSGIQDVIYEYTRENTEFTLYQGNDAIKVQAMQNMLEGYAAVEAAVRLTFQAPEEVQSYVSAKDLGVTRSMMDYYAVAMLVMILFMGSMNGASATFFEERRGNTLTRTAMSPENKTKVFLQTILGQMPMALLQVLTIMFCSTALFGAKYCSAWQDNVLLAVFFILVSMTLVALSALIGLTIKQNPMIFIMPVLWISMALSGTFSKEIYIEGISELMPAYQLQKAAFDLTVFGRHELIWRAMGVSAALLLACLVIGTIVYNKKKG